MLGAELGGRPDDHRDVVLPGTALIAVADEFAHVVDFLAVVGQEDDDGILVLDAPDDGVDDVVIVAHGIVVLRPDLPGGSILLGPARLICRSKVRKRSGIAPLEILVCPHQVHDKEIRLRRQIQAPITSQGIVEQRQHLFIAALRQIDRVREMARERLLVAARSERSANAAIEA